MKPATIHIVRLSKTMWDTFPAERPIASVCRDAEAAQRRIHKGVDLARERSRYVQLCSWIESVALERLASGAAQATLALDPVDTVRYLLLIEALQEKPDFSQAIRAPVRRTTIRDVIWAWLRVLFALFSTSKAGRVLEAQLLTQAWRCPANPIAEHPLVDDPRIPIGRTFFSPGRETAFQAALYRSMSFVRLQSLLPMLPAEEVARFARMAAHRGEFFAASIESGVIEVLSSVALETSEFLDIRALKDRFDAREVSHGP